MLNNTACSEFQKVKVMIKKKHTHIPQYTVYVQAYDYSYIPDLVNMYGTYDMNMTPNVYVWAFMALNKRTAARRNTINMNNPASFLSDLI